MVAVFLLPPLRPSSIATNEDLYMVKYIFSLTIIIALIENSGSLLKFIPATNDVQFQVFFWLTH